MPVDPTSPSVGIDRVTGGTVIGWEHVLQSIGDILTTTFGQRVIREWYGSTVPGLLGRLITPSEVVPFYAAIAAALEQWEPRFRIVEFQPVEVTRSGQLHVFLVGDYRPRAHLGDFTSEGARRVEFFAGSEGVNVFSRT